jgi:16S rRNA processing protein RimM
MSDAQDKIVVGKVSGVYGVKGWVKVYSYTEPREGIAEYKPWYLKQSGVNQGQWQEVRLEQSKRHAKTVIAKLEGFDDRNESMMLAGAIIGIDPGLMGSSEGDVYYWRDLIGLRVINQQGVELGLVEKLIETGANDVLVVVAGEKENTRERLIPWTLGKAVAEVDLEKKVILVDWDEAWE